MKKTVFLIISIILLILSIGTFGYLYYQNTQIEKEINESKDNIKKVEDTIKADQETLTEKEDEYEKLKEKVKDSLEELNIWESLKEELNKSLS
jgi:predicted negative regulator of RcsB-dependent stress response